MRQRLLLIGITCVLVLSGWSGVLASVLCPHAGRSAVDVAGDKEIARTEAVEVVVFSTGDETHDCCRIRLGGAASAHDSVPDRHVSPQAPHDAHAQIQSASHDAHAATPSASPASEPTSGDDTDAAAETCHAAPPRDASLDAPTSSCAHCMGRPEQPTAPASARQASDERRISTGDIPPDRKMHAPTTSFFIPATSTRRRAPPTGRTRRHVLNSIFLI